jgi:hypothetical protein
MAEYIDKQVYNDAIREAVLKYPNTFYNGLETARQIAHDLPAADVQPVRHGRWLKKDYGGFYWYECSECGTRPPKNQWKYQWLSPYCPYCGCAMEDI